MPVRTSPTQGRKGLVRRSPWLVWLIALIAALALAACDEDGADSDERESVADGDTEAEDDGDAAADEGEEDGDSDAGSDEELSLEDRIVELCPPDESPDRMVVGNWPGPNQAALEAVQSEFEEVVNTQIVMTADGTGDRLTRLHAEAGDPSMDVAFLPVDEVAGPLEEGVIMPFQDDVPESENLIDAARLDGGYGANLSQLRIKWNPEEVDDPPTSWTEMYEREEFRGRYGMPGIPGAPGHALLGMIAVELGGEPEDWERGIEFLAEHADDAVAFSSFGPNYEPFWESGEMVVHSNLASVTQEMIDRGVPMEQALPETGAPINMNVVVIPEGVQNEGCSKALAGWLLGETAQVSYAEVAYFQTANETVELPPDVAERVFPQEGDKVVDIDWDAYARDSDEIVDVWTRETAN